MRIGQAFNPYRMFVGAFVPNTIMRYKGISSTAKLVYARLAQYAGEKGEAFPKLGTLADEVGANERTVRRCISELEKEGFIKVEKPTGANKLHHKPSVYKFLWHPIFEENNMNPSPEDEVNTHSEPDKMSTSEGIQNVHSGPDKMSTLRTGQNVHSNIRESYEENHKENNIILPRNRKKRVYDEDSTYYKMAKYFHNRVTAVAREEGLEHLTIRANLQSWADEMRKLVEIDKVDKRLAKEVIDWVTTDPFWRVNVLSASKLRQKFSELALKMKASKNKKVIPFNRPSGKDMDRIEKANEFRNKEVEFQKWVMAGNDPNAFNWG